MTRLSAVATVQCMSSDEELTEIGGFPSPYSIQYIILHLSFVSLVTAFSVSTPLITLCTRTSALISIFHCISSFLDADIKTEPTGSEEGDSDEACVS